MYIIKIVYPGGSEYFHSGPDSIVQSFYRAKQFDTMDGAIAVAKTIVTEPNPASVFCVNICTMTNVRYSIPTEVPS